MECLQGFRFLGLSSSEYQRVVRVKWSRPDVQSDGHLLSSDNEFNQYNVSEKEYTTIQSEYMINRL